MKRFLLYFLLLFLVAPSLFLFANFTRKKALWQEAEREVHHVAALVAAQEKKERAFQTTKESFQKSDPLYLQKQVETLPLLTKEKALLEKMLSSPSFTGNPKVEHRFSFLSHGENVLHFQEKHSLTTGGVQESEETLEKAVHIDADDLKTLLQLIEAPHPQKPLCFLKNFSIKRHAPVPQTEVYELNMQLIKREFLPS